MGLHATAITHAARAPSPCGSPTTRRTHAPAPPGERYLSTVLFNTLWSFDADAEKTMPNSWRQVSGAERPSAVEPKL